MVEGRSEERTDAPDAFQALGNGVRLSILQTLLSADGPVSFSALHEASSVEESAGFAYHLRQLTDRYVRKVGEGSEGERETGYLLTFAGRTVARAVAAGTYTDSVDMEPIDLPEPCPFCDAEELAATAADNTVGIACDACGRPVLSLPFSPSAYRDRDPEAVPDAFDAHHRHRLGMLRKGVCPECSGTVTASVERVADPETDEAGPIWAVREDEGGPETGGADRVQSTFACDACGYEARSPVALTLLTHPAVVAFSHDHGVDVRDRPIWNVGDEWRETVLSTDPFAVAVSVRLDDELLELFVDRRATVVDVRRTSSDGDGEAARSTDEGDDGTTRTTDERPETGTAADGGSEAARTTGVDAETPVESDGSPTAEDGVDAGGSRSGDDERPEPA